MGGVLGKVSFRVTHLYFMSVLYTMLVGMGDSVMQGNLLVSYTCHVHRVGGVRV